MRGSEKGSIGFLSTASTEALGAASAATCVQPPGAAPKSTIRFFARHKAKRCSKSISLNAERER